MNLYTQNIESNLASLRLFRSLVINDNAVVISLEERARQFNKLISQGIVLDPKLSVSYNILASIVSTIGISAEKLNASFHKSWAYIENTPLSVLITQQLFHYFTTYGYEDFGIYDNATIYVPFEKLEIPKTTVDGLSFIKIFAITKWDLKERIFKLISSGVALSESVLNDLMLLIKQYNFEFDVDEVKNNELKIRIYDFYGTAPKSPIEYLRYILFKVTGETLLIKSPDFIAKIKNSVYPELDTLLEKAPNNLASIFYRYKPLFLALKAVSKNKAFFNKLRKKAIYQHEPLPDDYLNSITSKSTPTNYLSLVHLRKELSKVNVFRKIRLANALAYRMNAENNSIVYKVRNGKSYATEFTNKFQDDELYNVVLNAIANDIGVNVSGKTFYIPSNIHYALPATEKQFVDNFPTGTFVELDNTDAILGINWHDVDYNRIDLDLSALAVSGKIGWDRSYYTPNKSVLFSGDMTAAPGENGATELFYIKNIITEPYLLFVNYFNYNKDTNVPCRLIVANEVPQKFERNYMVDPNNLICSPAIEIKAKQNCLGIIVPTQNKLRYYFTKFETGKEITSNMGENETHVRNYLLNSAKSAIQLRDVLKKAGAIIVSDIPTEGEYVDLSPKNISKTSILDILS